MEFEEPEAGNREAGDAGVVLESGFLAILSTAVLHPRPLNTNAGRMAGLLKSTLPDYIRVVSSSQ